MEGCLFVETGSMKGSFAQWVQPYFENLYGRNTVGYTAFAGLFLCGEALFRLELVPTKEARIFVRDVTLSTFSAGCLFGWVPSPTSARL